MRINFFPRQRAAERSPHSYTGAEKACECVVGREGAGSPGLGSPQLGPRSLDFWFLGARDH